MAECGKPVIYLYPTEPTIVNVQVGIAEFTKTEPAYGDNGWTVLADTKGLLTNLADGLQYPYLFWEGKSDKNVILGQGFTIAKKDIATDLPKALLSLGLNGKETADFMEFWLPRLTAVTTPYVEISFADPKILDEIAPLTITPAPDKVLRVFMYYKGVNQEGLEMPAYTSFIRKGFTVIEWGGTLYQ